MPKRSFIKIVTSPKEFASILIKDDKIHIDVLILVCILVFIYRRFMLGEVERWVVLRPVISIILFAAAQYMVYQIGKGQVKFKFIFNVSIYFHLIVIIGTMLKSVPVISVLAFLEVQFLGIYYQYIIGMYLIQANKRFIKLFCAVELISAVFSVNYQLLTYLGRCVVYSEKTQFFSLIVK